MALVKDPKDEPTSDLLNVYAVKLPPEYVCVYTCGLVLPFSLVRKVCLQRTADNTEIHGWSKCWESVTIKCSTLKVVFIHIIPLRLRKHQRRENRKNLRANNNEEEIYEILLLGDIMSIALESSQ